ncbi:ribbon-helix-helix protein, CopG family [Geminicoccus roseus]|uniref:ribbon-helix-helix protein, CopG family n=1 Tax=Geminicoccus roseus TaxID=404900 RepID=UPI00040F9AFB|nr:ribbon-helix-helix protein, CopG family [Geminicoccus roseus]
MRISVDLGAIQVQALDELARAEQRSRTALIGQAIDEYLAKRRAGAMDDAFGLWGQRTVDGLACQDRLRGE